MDSELYLRGIKLFNAGQFFEAHEVLEDVWRAAPRSEKRFLQGLIQTAVALYHHSNGNLVGARSVLARASRNLTGYSKDFGGIQLPRLLHSLAEWQFVLTAEGKALPPRPQILPSDGG